LGVAIRFWATASKKKSMDLGFPLGVAIGGRHWKGQNVPLGFAIGGCHWGLPLGVCHWGLPLGVAIRQIWASTEHLLQKMVTDLAVNKGFQ